MAWAQAGNIKGPAGSPGTSGMLPPVLCMIPGDANYTIVGGSVTQIAGTSFYVGSGRDVTPVIGDRLLIAAAPAASGPGSAWTITQNPANGIYVVTGNTTNLSVARSSDMSGSINPIGLTTYIESGNWNYGGFWTVNYPVSGAFTYGTTSMGWIGTGGSNPSITGLYINAQGKIGWWNGSSNTYLWSTSSPSDVNVSLPTPAVADTLVSRTTMRTISTINSTVTLAAAGDLVAFLNAGAAPTLPTAVGNPFLYTLKNIDTANKTVLTTASQTIDGSTTITLRPNQAVDLISDGANWRIV